MLFARQNLPLSHNSIKVARTLSYLSGGSRIRPVSPRLTCVATTSTQQTNTVHFNHHHTSRRFGVSQIAVIGSATRHQRRLYTSSSANMGSQGEQRVGIVTGASSGMGLALTKHFVSKGWKIAMFDINEKVGKELATQLGPSTTFHHVDVSSYASQSSAFLSVFKLHGRIDALLANAGIVDRSSIYILPHRPNRTSSPPTLEQIPPPPDTSCTDVDFKGVLYGTQLAIHFMRHNPIPGGKIVATASVAGVVPHPSYPEYNGAKAAVINFIRGVAGVLQTKENIQINCVCPGIVATSIIPPEMVAAVKPEYLTNVETVVRAYEGFLDEDEGARFGCVVEASVDKVLELEEGKLANRKASVRAITVWDPLFKGLHGEDSGLGDAIP